MKTIDLIAVLSAAFALLVLVRCLVCLVEIRAELRRLRRQRERICQEYEQAAHDLHLLLALTIRQQTAVHYPLMEFDRKTGRLYHRINMN